MTIQTPILGYDGRSVKLRYNLEQVDFRQLWELLERVAKSEAPIPEDVELARKLVK